MFGSNCQTISSDEDLLNRIPANPPTVSPTIAFKLFRMKSRRLTGFFFVLSVISSLYSCLSTDTGNLVASFFYG
jgi:hypothetical protein